MAARSQASAQMMGGVGNRRPNTKANGAQRLASGAETAGKDAGARKYNRTESGPRRTINGHSSGLNPAKGAPRFSNGSR